MVIIAINNQTTTDNY